MRNPWSGAYEIDNILIEMEEIEEDDKRIAEMEKELIDIVKDMSVDSEETLMNKSFWYGAICREDILYVIGEEHKQKVDNLTDSDMSDLANRMYDGCIENYWYEVLEDAINTVFVEDDE